MDHARLTPPEGPPDPPPDTTPTNAADPSPAPSAGPLAHVRRLEDFYQFTPEETARAIEQARADPKAWRGIIAAASDAQRVQQVEILQRQTARHQHTKPNTRRRGCLSIRFQWLPAIPSFPSLKRGVFKNSGARKPASECGFPEFPEFPE